MTARWFSILAMVAMTAAPLTAAANHDQHAQHHASDAQAGRQRGGFGLFRRQGRQRPARRSLAHTLAGHVAESMGVPAGAVDTALEALNGSNGEAAMRALHAFAGGGSGGAHDGASDGEGAPMDALSGLLHQVLGGEGAAQAETALGGLLPHVQTLQNILAGKNPAEQHAADTAGKSVASDDAAEDSQLALPLDFDNHADAAPAAEELPAAVTDFLGKFDTETRARLEHVAGTQGVAGLLSALADASPETMNRASHLVQTHGDTMARAATALPALQQLLGVVSEVAATAKRPAR